MVEEGLVIELSSISGLSEKVFAIIAPQTTTAPYVTYLLTSAERPQIVQSGHEGVKIANFQLDVFHTTYSALKTLMALIVAKIKTFNFRTIGNSYIQQAEITTEFETYEDAVKLYRGVIEITISYRE